MCRPNDFPPYPEHCKCDCGCENTDEWHSEIRCACRALKCFCVENEMREVSFGPVVNPDGSPTETTLEIMGFKRRIGDTFNWYPRTSDYPSFVRIIAFTSNGVVVNYANDPLENGWEIPFSEAF